MMFDLRALLENYHEPAVLLRWAVCCALEFVIASLSRVLMLVRFGQLYSRTMLYSYRNIQGTNPSSSSPVSGHLSGVTTGDMVFRLIFNGWRFFRDYIQVLFECLEKCGARVGPAGNAEPERGWDREWMEGGGKGSFRHDRGDSWFWQRSRAGKRVGDVVCAVEILECVGVSKPNTRKPER